MKDGKLANVEFDTIPNVKDPWKELNPLKGTSNNSDFFFGSITGAARR
jgi:hypothetical protein